MMPNVLLLRFAAPMQSWGVSSRFSRRDTGKEPSKSGVIGLLCAALGVSRDEANIENPMFAMMKDLKMGVRVNRQGVLESDYHTAQNIAKADGGLKETELSTRFYLADADFLVGLESENFGFLETLQSAIKNPRWQIFLGRKAFVPSLPVYLPNGEGLLEGFSLREALKTQNPQDGMRLVLEIPSGDRAATEVRQDVPLSFADRRFTIRHVKTDFIILPKGENRDDPDSAV